VRASALGRDDSHIGVIPEFAPASIQEQISRSICGYSV